MQEIPLFDQLDPDVLEAEKAARDLLKSFRLCQDPLTKKIFKNMFFNAFGYKQELVIKSKAKHTVEVLHDAQTPKISKN